MFYAERQISLRKVNSRCVEWLRVSVCCVTTQRDCRATRKAFVIVNVGDTKLRRSVLNQHILLSTFLLAVDMHVFQYYWVGDRTRNLPVPGKCHSSCAFIVGKYFSQWYFCYYTVRLRLDVRGRGSRCISSPKHLNRLWVPPSLLFSGFPRS
jgi:hypothetical protein